MKKCIKYFVFVIFVSLLYGSTKPIKNEIKDFHTGRIWEYNTDKHINAHGGILYHDGIYYWYGEYKSDTTSSAMV